MKFEVIFDLETKNLFKDVCSNDPADLGVSIVSLYSREVDDTNKEVSGKLSSYWEKEFLLFWTQQICRSDIVSNFIVSPTV